MTEEKGGTFLKLEKCALAAIWRQEWKQRDKVGGHCSNSGER